MILEAGDPEEENADRCAKKRVDVVLRDLGVVGNIGDRWTDEVRGLFQP